ncbi:hypothetical protein MLD52_10090 [Puniceicoccaceae bacterium K14]|nr:hypothetical protein [Puniceicoccaceae bacterium K14]
MAYSIRNISAIKVIALAVSVFSSIAILPLNASDYTVESKESFFDAGQSGIQFNESFEKRRKDGFKIVDHENYRVGRTPRTSTVWTKRDKKAQWAFEDGMSIATLKKSHEANRKKGFVITEIEAVRNGMSLEFSAVWEKGEEQPNTIFYWGMDRLLFSNRYGEMADRGYRIVDFEAYEANGQILAAAIWIPKDGAEVRFFRGLDEEKYSTLSVKMEKMGYRINDFESYIYEDELLFAASWELMGSGEESKYDFNLLADAFYERNAELLAEGYRLVDFETYNKSVSELRYAGSWVKFTAPEDSSEEKDSFLDTFRQPK